MRLIDADALIPKGTKVTDDVIAVHNAIKNAHTIEAEPVRQWISVEERLPKEWEAVLVRSWCGYTECAVWLGIPGKWRCTWDHTLLESEITHWMPLPEPPNGAKMDKEE